MSALITRHQIAHVLQQGRFGGVANLLVALLFAALVVPEVEVRPLLAWVVCAVLLALLRSYTAHLALDFPPGKNALWQRRCVLLAGLSGGLWGVAASCLMPLREADQALLLGGVMAGMAAGGIPSFGAFLPAFVTYQLGILLPFGLGSLLTGNERLILVSGVTVFYDLFLLRACLPVSEHIAQDLRQRLALEELTASVSAAQASTETSRRVRDGFIANMSHELRTPLNAIIGLSELMERVHDEPRMAGYAHSVRKSAQSLLGIVSDVLNVTRLEADHMALPAEEFDLPAVLREVGDMFTPAAEDKGMVLRVTLADDLPRRVASSSKHLRQILMNLLSNAFKFTTSGAVRLEAACHTDAEDRTMLRMLITDSGIGMSKELLAQLFAPLPEEALFMERASRGEGLGLHITRTLVHLMGGEIRAESAPGAGSMFEVLLPVTIVAGSSTWDIARVR